MSASPEQLSWITITQRGGSTCIAPRGEWRMAHLPAIDAELRGISLGPLNRATIDGSSLDGIDTAGALLLYELLMRSGVRPDQTQIANLQPTHEQIVTLVRDSIEPSSKLWEPTLTPLEELGYATLVTLRTIKALLSIVGETFVHTARTLRRPGTLRLKELFVQLELTFLDAIPICALVTFLIGVVVAYLFAIQIEKYGANIFIVDAVTLAMCRELSPIIIAIIVAGRSGSAFTAHIGTMKLNEEVDALMTLGLSPMRVLVLPRLYALVVALPLLVFVGDVVGITGAMIVADLRLHITGVTFIERMQTVLPVKSLLVGLVKAPVFAAFIAVIGCRMGLSVENNARSVGLNTTSTVVQSIVSVILLNAAFAIIFVELGI